MINKHETLTPCWLKVGPPSATQAYHLVNIGLKSHIIVVLLCSSCYGISIPLSLRYNPHKTFLPLGAHLIGSQARARFVTQS